MTEPNARVRQDFPETEFHAIAVLAFNFYEQGRLEEASSLFRCLQLINPQAYYAHAGVGAVALAKRPPNLDEARENLARAAELNSNDPSVQASLGEVFLWRGEMENAARHLTRAVELDPARKDPGATRARVILSGLSSVVTQIKATQPQAGAAD